MATVLSVVALLGAACAGSGWNAKRGAFAAAPPATPLAADYVFAPIKGDAMTECDELAKNRDAGAQLRRSWILLERQQPQAAIDACAQVLYGAEPPSPKAEAYARYIRAEAFARRGEAERGSYDRERARELAADPWLIARLGEAPTAAPMATPTAPTANLVIQSRAQWRPTAPIAARLNPMGRIYRLTVHHSAMLFRDTRPEACAGQLRLIQHNHMQNPDRRYGDIGYHFLIDPAGRIWQGRELKWQGAHARNSNNEGNIGICLLGNFMRGGDGQQPSQKQLQTLSTLVHGLCDQYAIAADQIFSHSDFVVTACPGPFLETAVDRLAREVKAAAAQRPRAGRPAAVGATHD